MEWPETPLGPSAICGMNLNSVMEGSKEIVNILNIAMGNVFGLYFKQHNGALLMLRPQFMIVFRVESETVDLFLAGVLFQPI